MSLCLYQDRSIPLQAQFVFFFISNKDKAIVLGRRHRTCLINSNSTNLNPLGGRYCYVAKFSYT